MALEGTAGQRMGIYTAAPGTPGTPGNDAMLLLDMTAPRTAPTPSRQER